MHEEDLALSIVGAALDGFTIGEERIAWSELDLGDIIHFGSSWRDDAGARALEVSSSTFCSTIEHKRSLCVMREFPEF